MRCMPVHSTLVLYAAPTGTDTTALPALLSTDSGGRNSFTVTTCNIGNRHPLYAGQLTALSPLNATGVKAACGFPRSPYPRKPMLL